jgi:hypothetical protein
MSEPDDRERPLSKFSNDLILAFIEHIAQIDRMIASWSVIVWILAG